MKIKTGCVYLTRDGRKAWVGYECKKFFYAMILDTQFVAQYNKEGKFIRLIGGMAINLEQYDLIALWVDPKLEIAVEALEKILNDDGSCEYLNVAEETLKKIKDK